MNTNAQQPLAKTLRSQLETTIKTARQVAEDAARAALHHFGVGESRAPSYLTDDQMALRRRLRAHGRSLGDVKAHDDSQEIQHLVWETAYEHWHRMLFARFLAENHLLLWEPGAPVTLAECDELAQDPAINMGAKSGWELAGKLAARMLPQVFKAANPVLELTFAPEHQRELEKLLAGLSPVVFSASDSLGWVYQFWQSKRKEDVNKAAAKIGSDELSAVTQLFTEPWMVDFLLHNTLGAWWKSRHPDQPSPVPLTYLRTLDDGMPAAGKFEHWPNRLSDFKLLDPCCGSGHFLVAAFLMLVPMRMAEGLSVMDAVDFVLQENLHGLELDPRCVEIAVFALALAAWRYPDEAGVPLGVRGDMPSPNIACCGLKVAASATEWAALVPPSRADANLLRQELRLLHSVFANAPLLGSLLDPGKTIRDDLASSNLSELRELVTQALTIEATDEAADGAWEAALSAQGLMRAARLLQNKYTLVVTNVPYLTRSKQHPDLRSYCEDHYPDQKSDLATVFLERCLELCAKGGSTGIVMPQNWLFLSSYKNYRERSLGRDDWKLVARLGYGAFQTPLNAAPILLLLNKPSVTGQSIPDDIPLIDVAGLNTYAEKQAGLLTAPLKVVSQAKQLANPDAVVAFDDVDHSTALLNTVAVAYQGLRTGDLNRFIQCFWERARFDGGWEPFHTTIRDKETDFSGLSGMILWEDGAGTLHNYAAITRDRLHDMHESGNRAWGRKAIAVEQMGKLCATFYSGHKFDNSLVAIYPKADESLMPAIACFVLSDEYSEQVRQIDQSIKVTNATLIKVPFDAERWKTVAAETYPEGLPKPFSNDVTQWIFHGHPQPASDPLQAAVAKLLGYRWPAESDPEMELSTAAREWVELSRQLDSLIDDDGIVCLPAVRGEKPAHERLLALLIQAWESVEPDTWSTAVLDRLLQAADCGGKTLEVWLREKFFEQHVKLFQNRPFIWHIWDGLKDGFSALVNYHLLDTKNFEKLIHTYLGDWIRLQEAGVEKGTEGAQTRLAAAQDLKVRLEAIMNGEAPYDIFVRWKSLAEQPLGWQPDLRDGVRLNIRPFMTAGVLRHSKAPKLNIKWDKDRGADPDCAPWYPVFNGERINDHHTTLAEKQAARKAKGLS